MNVKTIHLLRHIYSNVRWTACLSLAAISLAACVSRSAPEAANANERLQGQGFSIGAPADDGWTIGSRKKDAIVFHKHPGKAVQKPDVAPYVLSAGVLILNDNAVTRNRGADFAAAARNMLARRLNVPDRDIVSLDVAPAKLHDATCVKYQAIQVDHYFHEKIEERNEYAQRGLLCVHPSTSTLLVQTFYTEQFLRDSPPAQRVGDNEVQAFFAQLQWLPLP